MSLDFCLPGLERSGAMDAGRSAEARQLYNELFRVYARTHGEEAAAAMASQATVAQLTAAAAHKRRNVIRQAQKQGAIAKRLVGPDGRINPKEAERVIEDVEKRRLAIKSRFHMGLDGFFSKFHANILGNVRNKLELEDLPREIREPGSTGNADVAGIAKAVTSVLEYARTRYNDAGGRIGKIAGYHPQGHSSVKVRDAGFVVWRDFTRDLLDREKMLDPLTGAPYSDQALELALRGAWETIRTNGLSKVTAGASGGKMLANQHAEHRFIHFKDADSFLAYEDRFGEGNIFTAINSHLETLARDIALMEILGPNPAAAVRWMKDHVQKQAALDTGPMSNLPAKAEAANNQVDRLYNEITGVNRRPEKERIALVFGTFRAVQTTAKLGSAPLSAVTDASFGIVARKFNGLPVTGMAGDYLKLLNPLNEADKKFAIRAGLIAEGWSHITAASHRFLGEELTGEFAQRLASGTMRASGLAQLTQAGRWAFGMELLGHLTDVSGTSFDRLSELSGGARLQRAMQRYGITADDWDVIRKAPIEVHKDVGWILPGNIEDPRVGDKLLEWIHTEVNHAVPMPDLRTRALMNRGPKRGTYLGEIWRSAFQFKAFSIGVMLMEAGRVGAIAMERGKWNAANYAVALFGATTIGGLVALQLKEIAWGKDPRPLTDKDGNPDLKLWGAAMLQGGGLGIYGDFLGQSENRYGGGFAETLAGPLVSSGQVFGDAILGNTFKAVRGDDTDVGADLVKILRTETPGSSLWYSKLAFNRTIADQLQEQIDPNYRRSWRAMERRAAERGQEFYWEPGETSPDRAPDMDNLLGGAQ